MGTRHLVAVVSRQAYKIAQYGQWDGYPSGAGASMLRFLHDPARLAGLRANIDLVQEAPEAMIKEAWEKAGAKDEWVSMAVSEKLKKRHPEWCRDTGFEILDLVSMGKAPFVRTDVSFAADSLFCEWAYVVDLDRGTFEIYQGGNKEPLPSHERFAFLEGEGCEEGWHPVRHLRTYQLDALPYEGNMLADLGREPDEA